MEGDQIELRVLGEELSPAVGPGLMRPWQAVLEDLRDTISPASWRSYLEPLRPVRLAAGRLSLAGPAHAANWSAIRYGELLLAAARRRMPELRAIEFLPERIEAHPARRITLREECARYRGWGPAPMAAGSSSRRAPPGDPRPVRLAHPRAGVRGDPARSGN